MKKNRLRTTFKTIFSGVQISALVLQSVASIVLYPALFFSAPQEAQAVTVPSGVIVAWPSTDGTIPAGWSRVTALDGYYLEGSTSTPSGSALGSANHTHTSPSHTHDIAHTHTGTTGGSVGGTASQAGTSAQVDNHTHSITTDANVGTNNPASSNFDTSPNDPPYTEVIWIQSNGTTGIPDGAWALYNSDTLPTNWSRQSGGRFLKGAPAAGNGGATGGSSNAHSHTDLGHTHTQNAHTHTGTVSASASGEVDSRNGTGLSATGHTHTISGGSTTATEQSGAGVVQDGDGQPPFYTLNIVQNDTGGADLPENTIAMWTGAIGSIPSGWVVCDGTGTCPNLNDSFIKGAAGNGEIGTAGGGLTHTHTAGAAHAHTINGHTHNFTVNGDAGGEVRPFKTGLSGANYTHTHTLSISDGDKTTGTQTVTADANTDNRPPYKEVVYIQYQPDDITVSSVGSQNASMQIPSTDQYVGGAFAMTAGTAGNKSITSITITETGSVDAQNDIDNIRLYYDYDIGSPFNCSSESFTSTSTENQFGLTDTDGFSGANGTATFTGTLTASTTQTVCVYVVVDVVSTATNGETLDIEITNPSTDVVLSSGSVSPASAVAIGGSTSLSKNDITVSSNGSQTATIDIPSTNQYVGGSFVFQENNSINTISSVTITEAGTVDGSTGVENVKIYYEYDTVSPFNCAAESFSGFPTPTETQFGSTDTDGFSGANGTATFSGGALTASTTQAICMYVVVDITASSTDGQTLEIEIADPSTDVTSTGTVEPATAVAISGSSTLNQDDVLIDASLGGSQVTSLPIPSTGDYIGGAFAAIGQNPGSHTITSVTIAETGTVDGSTGLENIRLVYDLDTSFPYNCASESYGGGETQFGSTDTDGFSGANGTATFSGSVAASTTQAVCFYAIMDVTASATNNQTVEIEITDPSTDVVLSSGTVEPNSIEAIPGTTVLTLDDLTVTYTGSQNASIDIPSTDSYVGGAFVISDNSIGDTHTITDITISASGTVDAQNNLDSIKLFYEYDTSDPYNCSSVSYDGGEAQFGTTDTDGFSGANGVSTFTGGSAVASTTQSVCVYVVLDVKEGASDGETLDIYINDPSVDVSAGAASVGPTSITNILGVTTLNQLDSSFTQSDFRIYDNANAIQPTTPLAAENTSVSDIISGQVLRFRMNIEVSSSTFATSSKSFKLQYSDKGAAGSCTAVAGGSFADVGQIASSTPWRGYNNTDASAVDGATTTATLLSASTVEQSYEEENPSRINVKTVPIGGFGEWDFVVRNFGAPSGTTYCFRMVESDGVELKSYTNLPEVTTRTAATWRELENTGTTVEKNESVRLRLQVDNQGGSSDSASYRLEFATSTFATSWTAVPVDAGCSSTAEDFRICLSDNYINLDPTYEHLTAVIGSSFVTGYMLESSNPAPSLSLGADEFTELEWKIEATNIAIDGQTYYFRLTDNGSTIEYSEYPELTVLAATSTLTQNYYRWYVDNDTLTPSDPWPDGGTDLGENTEITVLDTPPTIGDVLRLRMTVSVADRPLATSTQQFKLQYGERSGTCAAIGVGEWKDVGGIGSTTALWRGTSTTPVDGVVLSTDPPSGGDLLITSVSDVAGTFENTNPSAANPYNVPMTEDVEYDWVVENNLALGATEYCFRMVKTNDGLFDTYTYYPALITGGYEPTSENWRWYGDATSTTPTNPLDIENSAPIDIDFNDPIKLRITLKENSGAPGINQKFKLQYSLQSDFSSDVEELAEISACTATSTWCYADGAGIDNDLIASSTLSDADSCVAQTGDGCGTHNEAATSTSTYTHPANAASEFEFTIKHSGAEENTTYYFRVYDVTNNEPLVLGSSKTYPSLSTKGADITFTINGVPAGTSSEGVTSDVATEPNLIDFGDLTFGTQVNAIHRVNIDTNAPKGYQVFMYARQDMLGQNSRIEPVSTTNSSPDGWSTACGGGSVSCFGYHPGDDTLENGSGRFAADDTYARLSTTTMDEIAFSPFPVDNAFVDIVYRIEVSEEQEAGSYETEIVYIIVPLF